MAIRIRSGLKRDRDQNKYIRYWIANRNSYIYVFYYYLVFLRIESSSYMDAKAQDTSVNDSFINGYARCDCYAMYVNENNWTKVEYEFYVMSHIMGNKLGRIFVNIF